jgi:hypothetical protein
MKIRSTTAPILATSLSKQLKKDMMINETA